MNNRNTLLNELQEKINYKFKNIEFLNTSVTHSSYAKQKNNIKYNERLEFLGDSVLQLTITEYLFVNFKNKKEGELTKIRALIVCENSLYEVALKFDLGKYLLMSKGEEQTGGRERVSILADTVEALIAAIYLDQGLNPSKNFILNNFDEIITKSLNNKIILDYKTRLQELIQKNSNKEITYKLVKHEGPPHKRKFYVKVLVNEIEFGNGYGYSKKEAEKQAAKEALRRYENGE
ncbi:MAG: ribonuclease III [Clostridiaceae bacterium]